MASVAAVTDHRDDVGQGDGEDDHQKEAFLECTVNDGGSFDRNERLEIHQMESELLHSCKGNIAKKLQMMPLYCKYFTYSYTMLKRAVSGHFWFIFVLFKQFRK